MELDMLQIKINRARDELPKETIKAIDSVDWRAYILSLREKKGYSFEQLEDLELETELLLCGLLASENYPKELEERMKIPKPQVDLLVSEMNEFVFKKIKEELIRNTERKEIFIKKTEGENEQLRITNYELKDKEGVKNEQSSIKNYELKNKEAEKNEQLKITNYELEGKDTRTQIEIAPTEISAPTQKSETITQGESNILQKAGIEITDNNEQLRITNYELERKEADKNEQSPTNNYELERKEATDNKTIKSISAQKLAGSFQMPGKTTQYSLDNITKNSNSNGSETTKSARRLDPYRIDPNE